MADAAGQALEEPDVRAGRGQLDVGEALAAHLAQGHFHATLVANYPAMLHPLVFSAQAFPVGHRAKNLGTKKSAALRLEGPVVDGFRLGDLAVRSEEHTSELQSPMYL